MQFTLKSNQNYLTAQRIHAKNKAAFELSWWFKEYKNKNKSQNENN